MTGESRELVKMHEGFRFFSYLLLILSLYLNQIQYFKNMGIYLIEFEGLITKLKHLDFIAFPVYSKTVCIGFLMITCIGTKAKKDRELKVSALLYQLLFGLSLYWGSLLILKWQAGLYLLFSFWDLLFSISPLTIFPN